MTAQHFPATREGHRARLAATKPTQEEMDTAARVVRWLADHAHFWPQEWATVGDPTATETEAQLNWAADRCGSHPDDLITSLAEEAARDAHNRQARLADDPESVGEP